jgi:hypothetical protein
MADVRDRLCWFQLDVRPSQDPCAPWLHSHLAPQVGAMQPLVLTDARVYLNRRLDNPFKITTQTLYS